MPSIRDFVTTITTEEVRDSVYGFLTALGADPSDWDDGDPEAAIVWSVSATAAMLWNKYGTPAIASGFLDFAYGAGLKERARQGYGVDYLKASYATGTWTGTNASVATLGPYDPDDLVFVNEDGKTYRNDDTVSFLPGVPLPITISAVEPGSASNAAPGTITLQTTVLDLSGTNAAALIATDDEKEPALKKRCRLKLGALSPDGPRSAYEYVALTPTEPSGRWDHGVPVTKVKVSAWSETSTVDVLMAGPSGAIAGDLGTPGTDLWKLDFAIQTSVVPDGVTCTIASAIALPVPVAYQIYVPSALGLTSGEVIALVSAALVALFADPDVMPIGGAILPSDPDQGYVFKNVLEATILKAVPGAIQVSVTLPAADVEVDEDGVPMLSTITPTVTFT